MQWLLAELAQFQAPALVVGGLVTRAATKAALGSSPGASGEARGQAPGPRHVRGPQLLLASSPLGLGLSLETGGIRPPPVVGGAAQIRDSGIVVDLLCTFLMESRWRRGWALLWLKTGHLGVLALCPSDPLLL